MNDLPRVWAMAAALALAAPATVGAVAVDLTRSTDAVIHVFPPDPDLSIAPVSLRLAPSSRVAMSFSENFLGFSAIAGINVTPSGSATRLQFDNVTFAFDTPAMSLSGDAGVYTHDAAPPQDMISFEPTGFRGVGGITLTTPPSSLRLHGGSLTLTDFRVDLSTSSVHADVVGDNGVGAIDDLLLWHIGDVSPFDFSLSRNAGGPDACWAHPLCGSQELQPEMSATNLTLDAGAMQVFSQALALTGGGQLAMLSVGSFGTIAISAVPEPSALMMMGVGLVGLLGVHARRRLG